MNEQTCFRLCLFLQKQFKAHLCCALFQSSLFIFPHGRKEKRKAAAFPKTHKRGVNNKKTVGVEGEDEWRVVGEEILSFPAHNVLVSMTGQLQICFYLIVALCVW